MIKGPKDRHQNLKILETVNEDDKVERMLDQILTIIKVNVTYYSPLVLFLR